MTAYRAVKMDLGRLSFFASLQQRQALRCEVPESSRVTVIFISVRFS